MPLRKPEAGSSSANAIELRGVGKTFGSGAAAFVALRDVSTTIEQNVFFTLLGPSGCGKTTLLRLIAGFEAATTGEILLHGKEIADLPPYRRPVNTVFQSYALFPHMTVAQNVAFGLQMLKQPKDEIARTVDEMLNLVQMEALKNRRTSELSGGQQQRVALARALAPKPRVLLLDEPLSALDLKLRKEMQVELKRLQTETGITFVFVTHDQEEALTMSDKVAVMNEGQILQIGTPREIYNHPANRFVADFIGDINFIKAEIVEAGKTRCTARFDGNQKLSFTPDAEVSKGQKVTLAVRPERIAVANGKNALSATLDNVVYHGTDTLYHFSLGDGTRMLARRQNSDGTIPEWQAGDPFGWGVGGNAVAIVADGPEQTA